MYVSGKHLQAVEEELARLRRREQEWDGYEQLHDRLTAQLAERDREIQRLRDALLTEVTEHQLRANDMSCDAGNFDGGNDRDCEHCQEHRRARQLEEILFVQPEPTSQPSLPDQIAQARQEIRRLETTVAYERAAADYWRQACALAVGQPGLPEQTEQARQRETMADSLNRWAAIGRERAGTRRMGGPQIESESLQDEVEQARQAYERAATAGYQHGGSRNLLAWDAEAEALGGKNALESLARRPSISVTLHNFVPDENGEDRCAFVYQPLERRCNVEASGHKPLEQLAQGQEGQG